MTVSKSGLRPGRSPLARRNTRNGLLFISPWIIGFLVFTLLPICLSGYYSLTDYNVIKKPEFVGLKNYVRMFHDSVYLTGLKNTLYMVIFSTTATIIVTLLVSFLLNNRNMLGQSFFRVVFFIPTLVPLVILSILWIWLFQPMTGLVNNLLRIIGISGPGWYASQQWAKPTFILMNIWCAGNMIIIFLAALQDIPEELYEAVEIDGGNFWHKSFYISLPLLRPVIIYNIITCMIRILQSFAESFIITNGGPNNATMFYSLYLYKSAFAYFKMGYASAMAWMLFLISMAFTFLMFKLTEWGRE